MTKKLSEKQVIEILVTFILNNSDEMIAFSKWEKCFLKLEDISQIVLKEIREKIKEKQRS